LKSPAGFIPPHFGNFNLVAIWRNAGGSVATPLEIGVVTL